MKKIISLFQRNYDGDRQVRNEVVTGAEWVINGEGVPTRKHDGTSCMVLSGMLYKRYDAKNGKAPPAGFVPAQDPDPVTGHWPGWVLVTDNDKWHIEAARSNSALPDGTYELVGPKVNGNKEKYGKHVLIAHGCIALPNIERTFDSIKQFLQENKMEGIVWHHPDGRMVKIKSRDFGIEW